LLASVLALSALSALTASGCASLPTLTERPEEYHLYRASRIAPTQALRYE